MTLRCFLPVVLFSAQTVFGQLVTPAADRLADYHAWFDPLNPAGGLVAPGLPTPGPSGINTADRYWVTWAHNVPPNDLPGPIVGTTPELFCEVVFLGCTGSGWSSFGYRLSGGEDSLCTTPTTQSFGSYALPQLTTFDTLDFFVERTDGSRYYAFDKSNNSAPEDDGYWGTLIPLASCRGEFDGYVGLPFAVFAFSPDLSVAAPELFVFAVRAGVDVPVQPVPEPATYGALAAAALAAAALVRRRRTRETSTVPRQ